MIISELRNIIGCFWVAQAKRDIKGGSKKNKKNQAANEKLLPDSVYALRDNRIDLPRQIRMPDESGNSK